MPSEKISIEENTYQRLDAEKGEEESFNEVIDRLLRKTNDTHPLEHLAGLGDDSTIESLRSRSEDFRESVKRNE